MRNIKPLRATDQRVKKRSFFFYTCAVCEIFIVAALLFSLLGHLSFDPDVRDERVPSYGTAARISLMLLELKSLFFFVFLFSSRVQQTLDTISSGLYRNKKT